MSLDSGLLYQRLMYVPGLTGTWRERADQYMRALTGKPYDGSLQTGLYLLDQISNRNFPQVAPAPAPAQQTAAVAPAPVVNPVVDTARKYTDPITGQVASASEIPQFENVMPFLDAWNQLAPQAKQAAESQINPEAIRQYNQAYEGYMGNLVNTGGQRFGRGFDGGGLSGIGSLKAGAERNRLGQVQDWLGAYQRGFQDFFYNPSRDAWNTNKTSVQPGQTFDQTITMPTWDDLYKDLGNTYGTGSSPFYG